MSIQAKLAEPQTTPTQMQTWPQNPADSCHYGRGSRGNRFSLIVWKVCFPCVPATIQNGSTKGRPRCLELPLSETRETIMENLEVRHPGYLLVVVQKGRRKRTFNLSFWQMFVFRVPNMA